MSDWWICIFKQSNFARILSCLVFHLTFVKLFSFILWCCAKEVLISHFLGLRRAVIQSDVTTVRLFSLPVQHCNTCPGVIFYEYNNINEVMQTFSALMKHSVCVLFQSHSFQSIFFSSSFYALVSQAPNNPWIYKWESKSPESVFYFCIADFFFI